MAPPDVHLAEHEARVAALVRACTCFITFKFLIQNDLQNHELESLRPLKLCLMDREGQIDQLRAKISDQNQELEALRSAVDGGAGSRVIFLRWGEDIGMAVARERESAG